MALTGREMRPCWPRKVAVCSAKVGVRAVVGQEPVALVKQGDKFDTLSVQEFATALYGEGTTCVVIPASEKER